eukprot:TRINITY_DN51049_c0_g1_i3.p2 TRINITY_DN51049_c0_g1~~TRINITY_DN51049_c0_g1_i3.p2  ORF type:complete len:105 (+),score=15.19 TRINITY_DN51049_c0_g1_i3:93-407(+)
MWGATHTFVAWQAPSELQEKRRARSVPDWIQSRISFLTAAAAAGYTGCPGPLVQGIRNGIFRRIPAVHGEDNKGVRMVAQAPTGEIGRAVQQECRDRSRMPSSA